MTETQKTDTATMEPDGTAAAIAADDRLRAVRMRGATVSVVRQVTLLPALIVLVIVGSIVSPAFLTGSNLTGIGQQVSSLGVIVVGEALILLTGGMDLSLESTYGFAPMLAAALILPKADFGFGTEIAPALGLLVLVAVAVLVGLVNGLLIVKARLNGFIVTLAMVIVLEGLQNGIVKGQSLFALPASFTDLGAAELNGVPLSLIACVIVFVLVGLFLRYHRSGRAIYALGGNIAAARAAGINVDRVRIGTYIAGSVLAAIGGLMEAGRVSAVTATQGYGEGIIFPVFAAAVIGGVSLKGGRGNMIGAASGVILLGIVQNILNLANVSSYWIDAINGSVILIALVLARIVGGAETVE
jgi:simple sugar transport system permease protein